MRSVAFVSPGFAPDHAHLQPWVYVARMAEGLRARGWRTSITPEADRAPDADVVVWTFGPTSVLSAKRRVLERIPALVGFVPGPIYQVRELVGIGPDMLREPMQYRVHALAAAIPTAAWARKLAHCRLVIAPTRRTAGRVPVEAARLRHIPGGIDAITPSGGSEILQSLDLEPGRFYVNFGPVDPVRGTMDLALAARQLPGNAPSVLFLVRPRSDNAKMVAVLRRQLNSSSGTRTVVDTRALTRESLFDIVRQARASVLPFRIVQSCVPLAILESLSLGVPVVSTRVDCIPEVLPDDAGRIVRPRDPAALAAALTELGSQREWERAKEAAMRCSRRTWTEAAAGFGSALEEMR